MARSSIYTSWNDTNNLESELTLRPHHLLCLHGFHGYGYTKEFIQNMYEVLQKLISNPNQLVSLHIGFDIICNACTDKNRSICVHPDSLTNKIDKRLLHQLKSKRLKRIPLTQLLILLYKNIQARRLHRICRSCKWQELGFCITGFKEKRLLNLLYTKENLL